MHLDRLYRPSAMSEFGGKVIADLRRAVTLFLGDGRDGSRVPDPALCFQ